MPLSPEQRAFVLEHLAAGVHKWQPMRELCAEFEEPFDISFPQFKRLRKEAGVKVAMLRDEGANSALKRGLALKAKRVARLKTMIARMETLIADRAEEMEDEIAGGGTGLLLRDYKGEDGRAIYREATALLKEYREYLKQIAIEVGEWTEKKEVSGPEGKGLMDGFAEALAKAYGNTQQPPTD